MRNGLLNVSAAVLAVTFAGTLAAPRARGQGTVGSQGFGYPPGELSTRALGTAGALGEIDARSPINPASLANSLDAQVYAQYDPELRTVTSAGKTSKNTISRMPNIGGVLPINSHLVFGVSAATMLDRTWSTNRPRSQLFGDDTVAFDETLRSEGAITDVRFALGYAVGSRLRVGVAYHTFPGSLRLTSNELFVDTTRYQDVTQVTVASFSGSAVSAGIEADILPSLTLSVSGRVGGSMKMFANDSLLSSANAPNRYSGSISFTGIPGTTIAARASHETWSRLDGLSTLNTTAVDANDLSFGVESSGPKIGGGSPILLRAGVRRRTLPFDVGTSSVRETSIGGGLGIPIAFDHVTLDVAVLHASRTGVAGVEEHAYNLSFGLRVRPYR